MRLRICLQSAFLKSLRSSALPASIPPPIHASMHSCRHAIHAIAFGLFVYRLFTHLFRLISASSSSCSSSSSSGGFNNSNAIMVVMSSSELSPRGSRTWTSQGWPQKGFLSRCWFRIIATRQKLSSSKISGAGHSQSALSALSVAELVAGHLAPHGVCGKVWIFRTWPGGVLHHLLAKCAQQSS